MKRLFPRISRWYHTTFHALKIMKPWAMGEYFLQTNVAVEARQTELHQTRLCCIFAYVYLAAQRSGAALRRCAYTVGLHDAFRRWVCL